MKSILTALGALAVAGVLTAPASAQFSTYPTPPAPAPALLGAVAPASAAPAPQPCPQPCPQGADCGERPGDCYGAHPILKRLFGIKPSTATDGGRAKALAHKSGLGLGLGDWFHDLKCKYGPPKDAAIPAADGGTLAFPHHPFVRGPRDFFMVEQR